MISFRSVRSRLLLAAIVVEGVMLTLLVSNSLRLTNYFMVEQLEQQHQQMTPVLTAATVAPLAQRDYATVQSVLNESLSKQGVRYLAVVDAAGSRVASAGLAVDAELPEPDGAFDLTQKIADPVYHVRKPIVMYGQPLGTLQIGLDLTNIFEARKALMTQGALIAFAELILSFWGVVCACGVDDAAFICTDPGQRRRSSRQHDAGAGEGGQRRAGQARCRV